MAPVTIPILRYDSGARAGFTRAYIEQLAATTNECDLPAVEQAIARLDYQDALARVLARAVTHAPIPAELMAALFPWCRPPDGVGLVALAEGERGPRLVELSERGQFPQDFDGIALRGLALHAAWILEGEALRGRITRELHRLWTRWPAPKGYYYATIAAELARVLGEDSIAPDHDALLPQDVLDLRTALNTRRERVLQTMLEDLKPAPPAPHINWDTLRPAIVRTAPKVSRNEPCPCGSGKKYKRCHGETDRDGSLTPSTLTVDEILAMRTGNLYLIQPAALADAPLWALLQRFFDARARARAEQVLEVLSTRPGVSPDRLDNARGRMIEEAAARHRHDFVHRHLSKVVNMEQAAIDPVAYIGLAVRLRSPDLAERLMAAAESAVKDDTGKGAESLAQQLLFGAPALGILIARGSLLTEQRVADAFLSMIEEARAQLGLSSADLAVRIHAAFQHEREAREARAEAEGLRGALHASTQRIRELEQRGRALEAQRREPDTTPPIESQSNGTVDPAEVRALREKIDTLQARIREGNEERAALRRQLSAMGANADGERTPSGSSVATAPDDDEEMVPTDLIPRRIVVPCWSRPAEGGLRTVPAHVAIEALRTVADLAGGDVAAWRVVKRPRRLERPVLMVRIGIHHRLIFDVEADSLRVLELFPRSGLDVAIKRLRTT